MRRNNIPIWLTACVLATALRVFAGDSIVLFDASTAGLEVWSCQDANITIQNDRLVLGQNNPTAKLGSAVIEDRFAYQPNAVLEIDTESVLAGTFAFQVLAFNGETFLGTVDLFKESTRAGIRTIRLGRLALLPGTEFVTFKCWLSRAGSIALNNVKYYVPTKGSALLYEQQVDATTQCETDGAQWTPSDEGGVITLTEGATFGSVLFPEPIIKAAHGTLVIETEDVDDGTVTVQLLAYDREGAFLSALDAVQGATAGASVPLADLEWPPETAHFKVKVWLGGQKTASARIKRLIVLR